MIFQTTVFSHLLILLLLTSISFTDCKVLKNMNKNFNFESNIDNNKFDTILTSIDIESKHATSLSSSEKNNSKSSDSNVIFGIPRPLFAVFCSFILDAMSVGLVMPLLPFFAAELGANAFQLSLVISSNYVAQMIGCVVMGLVSDRYGRKSVILCCLFASSLQFMAMSFSTNLVQLASSRIICGIFGGLVPQMQSSVADVIVEKERPKYLGRVTAAFGLGFILGPAFNALLSGVSIRTKIRIAFIFPFLGWLNALFFVKETNPTVISRDKNKRPAIPFKKSGGILSFLASKLAPSSTSTSVAEKIELESPLFGPNVVTSSSNSVLAFLNLKPEVFLLILNGFLLMFAFSTETIYAYFIKDAFGLGEHALSMLFAMNGLLIGLAQMFLIKPLVGRIGKHATLALGNAVLAIGMVGVALVRSRELNIAIFAVHVVGYSLADTAVASLVTRYSPSDSQGRALSLNQAAQASARIISPLIAGLLYEYSNHNRGGLWHWLRLPRGALPFLFGATFPAVGVIVPSILYAWSMNRKALEKLKTERPDSNSNLVQRPDGTAIL